LGNSPDSQVFEKFHRFPEIWEIPEISKIPVGICRNFRMYTFKILEISKMTGYLEKFPKWVTGKFPI